MPETTIHIGGRSFEVACQEGEEQYLQSAAGLLDEEAAVLVDQVGRLPEARMLLMAGLMLADKTAVLQSKVDELKAHVSSRDREIDQLKNTPPPKPERVEVPVFPEGIAAELAELVTRSETLARTIEEKSAGGAEHAAADGGASEDQDAAPSDDPVDAPA